MSQTLAQFEAATNRMFERAQLHITLVAKRWIILLAWELISTTPGPNLQEPDDTEYIATGRLRASWGYGFEARPIASRWDGGPYTEHGEDTLAEISAAVMGDNLPRYAFLQSDIAYGYIVHEGLGRHHGARPWVQIGALNSETIFRQAQSEVSV